MSSSSSSPQDNPPSQSYPPTPSSTKQRQITSDNERSWPQLEHFASCGSLHKNDPTECALQTLKMRRLSDFQQDVYIPPSAKPSLQAPDKLLFPLMERVDDFLAGAGQVMLVLGDSGAGKSTFNRYLEHQLWHDYKSGGAIPLLINLPALDRPDKDLVAEQLRVLDFTKEQIGDLKENRRFVLICDGYDESQLACNLYTTNRLNQSGHWRAKLVITCRTQYLGQNYQDRFEPHRGSYYDLSASGLFTEAVIAPFSKDQIAKYVERYVPLEPRTWVREDYMEKLNAIPGLMGLVRNPFLLSLALGALPAVVEGKDDLSKIRISRVQLYDSFVQHWLGANKRRLRGQNQKLSRYEQRTLDELLDDGFEEIVINFQTDLAAAIFQEQEGRPVVDYDRRRDKNSWKRTFFNTELETSTLRDASLLIRASNLYLFIHRSMLEYFYSCAICPPPFVGNEFAPHGLSYSASTPLPIADHPLSKRNLVTEPSVVQFLAERSQTVPEFKRQLRALIKRSTADEHASQAAANAITILIKAGVRFNGADLRGVRIPGADLCGGQFDSAQFQDAILTGANLTKCWIRQADFTNARMRGVHFGELPYLEEDNLVHTCAYSPDGSTFAFGLINGDIYLYDTTTWRRVQVLVEHERDVISLAFSPSGHRLLSGSFDMTVRIWNIETGLSEFILKVSAWVKSVAFSPCGKQIASASEDKTVRLWDAQTGAAVSVLATGLVAGVSYSPGGERIATGGKDGVVRVFDTQTGFLSLDFESQHKSTRCIAYSPDGQWIITGHDSGKLQLWDMNTGEQGPEWLGHTDCVTGVDFSPNSKWVASSSFDRTVKLWNARTRTLVSTFAGHTETAYCVAFSPDGSQIASGGWDSTVRLWDVTALGTGLDSHGSFDSASSMAYSPDGGYLVIGSKDGTVLQYNADTGEQEMAFSCGPYQVRCIAYSPDGLYIVTARDNELMLWDASTGVLILTFSGHTDIINAAAFSPCGYWIATGSNDMTVVLWEVESAELSTIFIGHSHWVNSVSFSPTGLHIVSGSNDGTVRIWELSSGESEMLVSDGQHRDGMVAYSPIGSQIASNTTSTQLRLQDEMTGEVKHTLEHEYALKCFAFSVCGQWIATCYGNWVQLWNYVPNGTSHEWSRKALVGGLVGEAICIAWRPGTLEFTTGSVNGSTRVWRLRMEQPKKLLVEQVWSIGPATLVTADAVFRDAVGLSSVNRKLLSQRSIHVGSLLLEAWLGKDDAQPPGITDTDENTSKCEE